MRRLLLLCLVATTGFAAPISSQTPEFAGQVDEATLAALSPLLADASRDSLPVAALEAKALEGRVKGHSPDVIGKVLSELAQDFRDSRDALRAELPDRPLTSGEIVAASLARSHSVPDAVIVGLMDGRLPGSMEIPVTVLGELVRRGVSPGDAAWVIRHVAQQEISMSRVAQIPGRFDVGMQGAGSGRPGLLRALQSLGIPGPPSRPPGPPGRDR